MAKKTTTAKKKTTVTRKKKASTSREKTTAAEIEEDTATPAVEAPIEAKVAKQTKRKSRSRKKTTKADESRAGVETTSTDAPVAETHESAPENIAVSESNAPPPPNARKKTRRRHKAKTPHGVAESPPTVVSKPESTIQPRSSHAMIERSDDAIVIRFPSVDDPPRNAKPRDDDQPAPEAPAAIEETSANAVPVEPLGLEPDYLQSTIDWDDAEPPVDPLGYIEEAGVDDAAPSDEAPPVSPSESALAPPADGSAPAEPKRGRSRRRRRRKPRHAEEKAEHADQTAKVEAEHDRARPDAPEEIERIDETEPTDEAEPTSEPAVGEKTESGRRKRSRRGRGRGSKARKEAAEETLPEPAPAPAPARGKEMIINVSPREECRIAIVDNGKLQEIYLERSSSENYVGNIYKGIVTNVEPSIQAAFIDFGQGKNGFLHVSDLHPKYFPNGEGDTENVGRKMPRRSRPPIQRCLRRGQQVLVQITKEGIGTKGPTLTTYPSIPGRFLVMMPGMRQLGVSRKIEDDDQRRKLKQQLAELELPDDAGFIARTAALDRTKRELQSDLNYLSRLWKSVDNRIKKQKAPAELYTESDLVTRTIRDVYTNDIARILIDNADVARRANEFISIFSPRSRDIVVHYDEPEPIFHRYGIEDELNSLHSRYVPLESGGSLVIDQTEALVAIDVNSGRFRTEDDAETTAYKMDLEAADEIPRQLRLRDLGGVVICDFIDVRMEKHKREIERRLIRNLKEHKERAKVLRMSDFGIIELTRQRQRASLTRNVYKDCAHCHGTGLVKTAESVTLDVMRTIHLAATKENIATIDVTVSMEVADLLLNRKRTALHGLETSKQRKVSIHTSPEFGLDQILVQCHDQRGRLIPSP